MSEELVSNLVEANNDFGLRLFRALLHKENVFISPTSIAQALSLALGGAKEKTLKAMTEALSLQKLPQKEIGQANAALLSALRESAPKVELSIANAILAQQSIKLRPEFLKAAALFDAEVRSVDFESVEAIEDINEWASKKTMGKIKEVVRALSPKALAVLLNAVYFKAEWSSTFDRSRSIDGLFRLEDGTKKSCTFMFKKEPYQTLEGNDFFAVRLPYGAGSMSMYLFRPYRDIKEFCQRLHLSQWNEWRAKFIEEDLMVVIPRFTIECSAELSSALSRLGMGIAFEEERANFEDLAAPREPEQPGLLKRLSRAFKPEPPAQRFFLDTVIHKTYLEVNEEGTVAAAVTASSVAGGLPSSLVFDRPFVCVIHDQASGAILFVGAIQDPGGKSLTKEEAESMTNIWAFVSRTDTA